MQIPTKCDVARRLAVWEQGDSAESTLSYEHMAISKGRDFRDAVSMSFLTSWRHVLQTGRWRGSKLDGLCVSFVGSLAANDNYQHSEA
jgi:hypothetical protein